MNASAQPLVSVVVPCFNEAGVLDAFYRRLNAAAANEEVYRFEFVFVNDGSTDATEALVDGHADKDPRVRRITLSRNFGHQMAIMAGIDLCSGDYAIIIDADLQDPPELIHEILERLGQGFDLVHMVRMDRSVDAFWKRASATLFYWFMRSFVLPEMPANAPDFKGFSRPVLEALRRFRESRPFLRGALASMGFRQTSIAYRREIRAAGRSKYPPRRVLDFGANAVVSMSLAPIRLVLLAGFALSAATLLFVCLNVALWAAGLPCMAGPFAFLAGVTGFVGGAVLTALGIVGEYAGRALQELKGRPLYLVQSVRNLELAQPDLVNRV